MKSSCARYTPSEQSRNWKAICLTMVCPITLSGTNPNSFPKGMNPVSSALTAAARML
jgi:hypothetical protein